VVVDCSHGNSEKDFRRQAQVMSSLCDQIDQGQAAIRGVMLESNLVEGNQSIVAGQIPAYGQSITDACLSLADTGSLLELLATTVRRSSSYRRAHPAG
jgi:3-deoxy-7-phosphoheptulonate synthase